MPTFKVSGEINLSFSDFPIEADSEAEAKKAVEDEFAANDFLDYVDNEDVTIMNIVDA